MIFLPCVPATPPRFNNLYSKPVSWSGLASAPHPAGAPGLKAGQKKCLRGGKVGDRNACDPCQLTSVFSSQAAADEQEYRDKKRKGEKPVGDHKSTEKLEAEICWAFIPRVSTLSEKPNHVMRGRGSHCVLILQVDSNSSFFSVRKELVQLFLLFSELSSSRFFKHPVPSPPRYCSPGVLPVSWLQGFMHQLFLCGDPIFTGSQNNKLDSGYS